MSGHKDNVVLKEISQLQGKLKEVVRSEQMPIWQKVISVIQAVNHLLHIQDSDHCKLKAVVELLERNKVLASKDVDELGEIYFNEMKQKQAEAKKKAEDEAIAKANAENPDKIKLEGSGEPNTTCP